MNKPNQCHCIAIADDHPAFRQGLISILEMNNYKVVVEAENGFELLEKLALSPIEPVLCILDIKMPKMNGLQTLYEMKSRWPTIKTLFISMFDHANLIATLFKSGACGYVSKDENPDVLLCAIDAIIKHGYYNNSITLDKVFEISEKQKLNEKECEFIRLCCEELTYAEIADKLNMSPRTAEDYRTKLFHKLNVKSRTGIVMFAVQNAIV